MNILEVVNGYPPDDLAGVPKHVDALVHNLDSEQYCACVLAAVKKAEPNATVPVFRTFTFPFAFVPYAKRFKHRYFSWSVRWTGLRLCRLKKIDIIHGHTWPYGGRQAIALGQKNSLPVVVTLHGMTLDPYSEDNPPEWLKSLSQAAYIIVQKQSAREKLIRWGIPEARTAVIVGPVDSEYYSYDNGLDLAENNILFAGRLDPVKNPLIIPEIAQQLNNGKANYKLIVAGDGPMRKQLHEMVTERNLEACVNLLGWVDDMRKVYAKSRFFLALSETHNSSDLTLLEAMSCGLIPIVVDSPGISEIITDRQNGFICKKSPVDIVAKIHEAMQFDDLRRISENARQAAINVAGIKLFSQKHQSVFDHVYNNSVRS